MVLYCSGYMKDLTERRRKLYEAMPASKCESGQLIAALGQLK